jgi:hypothetical protein
LTTEVNRLLAGDYEAVFRTEQWPVIALRADRGRAVPNRHVELFPPAAGFGAPFQQQPALRFTFPSMDWVRLAQDPTGGIGGTSAFIPGGRMFQGTTAWTDPRSMASMEDVGELITALRELRPEDRQQPRNEWM